MSLHSLAAEANPEVIGKLDGRKPLHRLIAALCAMRSPTTRLAGVLGQAYLGESCISNF